MSISQLQKNNTTTSRTIQDSINIYACIFLILPFLKWLKYIHTASTLKAYTKHTLYFHPLNLIYFSFFINNYTFNFHLQFRLPRTCSVKWFLKSNSWKQPFKNSCTVIKFASFIFENQFFKIVKSCLTFYLGILSIWLHLLLAKELLLKDNLIFFFLIYCYIYIFLIYSKMPQNIF